MNKSIRSKLFKWNIALVIIVLMSMFAGVQLFSEQIYKQKTIQLLEDEIALVNTTMNKGDVELAILSMDSSAFRLGATLLLYSDAGELLFMSSQSSQSMRQGMGSGMGHGKGNSAMGGGNTDFALGVEEGKLTESVMTSGKALLFYRAALDNGSHLIIQLPEEKIEDALWVFKELLLYVSVLALMIALLASVIMSKQLSQPIVALKEIAESIKSLDFDKRYTGAHQDEIGDLGESLNALSIELESTINKLKLELDKEKTMDALRTQFVAQASHELQTPLTVISNYIEAIEDDMVSLEEMPDHIKVIQDEIEGMSLLVRGLLDLNQLRSGKFKFALVSFDITELVRSELEVLKADKSLVDLKIDSEIIDESFMVLGDTMRLKQAVRNLTTNGIKHSDGQLVIATRIDSDIIEFSVENSGKAIKEEELETLWEVFYKEEGNHKKGTGLGLAITKVIIGQHKGSCGIENTAIGVKSYFRLQRQT